MAEAWTIRRVLAWTAKDFAARGIETGRLDAELLVAEALGIDRVRLYMDLDRPLDAPERARIRELVARRRLREPVAYILGRREFYKRSFEVTPAVLIPRPETETVVERALAILPPATESRVLDVGTGSGILAVTLAAERPGLRVDATDLSAVALEVARRNAAALGVADRIAFHEGDLFAPLGPDARYALVVSNPPYVADGEMEGLAPDVARYEPRVALTAGREGLAVVRRLAAEVGRHLEAGGTVLLEVGAGQAPAVSSLLAARDDLTDVCTHRDLGGIERVVEARRR